MKFDIWPVCIPNATNKITAGNAVQGILPTDSFRISIENSQEDEDSGLRAR
jgi:hypothetical protein